MVYAKIQLDASFAELVHNQHVVNQGRVIVLAVIAVVFIGPAFQWLLSFLAAPAFRTIIFFLKRGLMVLADKLVEALLILLLLRLVGVPLLENTAHYALSLLGR